MTATPQAIYDMMNIMRYAHHCVKDHELKYEQIRSTGEWLASLCDDRCGTHFEIMYRLNPEAEGEAVTPYRMLASSYESLWQRDAKMDIFYNGLHIETADKAIQVFHERRPFGF